MSDSTQHNDSGLVGLGRSEVKPLIHLIRPEILTLRIDLKFDKTSAQKLFPTLAFEKEETHAIITEVLRPGKQGEEVVVRHHHAKTDFVVDHYELGGVTL